jgi:F-type H+-transporting ATPase subunit a
MANNPMQQFSVHKIGPEIKIAGIDLSFTNASLFMVISASIILLFLFLGTKEKKNHSQQNTTYCRNVLYFCC